MIELVHEDRDGLVQRFGCSRRLATRLGALMARRIAVSGLLVEEARPGTTLEALLLRKALIDTDDLAGTLEALQQEPNFGDLAEELPLAVTEQDDWTVIAAEEEVLAETAWASAPSPSPQPLQSNPQSERALSTPVNSVPTASKAAGKDAPDASAFSQAEIARLRVHLFAAPTSAERVAALKQLSLAGLPREELARLFLQAAGNEDRSVRAAAAGALRTLGLPGDMADTARLVAEGTEDERAAALDRLRDLATGAPQLGLDATLMAIMGLLRDGNSEEPLRLRALDALAESAPSLGVERVGNEDVLRVVLQMMLAPSESRLRSVKRALHAIDQIAAGLAIDRISEELSRSRSPEYRGLLVELAAGLSLTPEQHDALLEAAAEAMLEFPCNSDTSAAAGHLLVSAGDAGALCLAARLPQADHAHQRHIIRLFDNALISHDFSPESREAIASAALEVLHSGPKQVRAEVIETHVLARTDIPDRLREEAATAFLSDLRNYARWPLSETLENSLVALGAPASGPLLRALAEHKGSENGTLIANALGRIGRAQATADDPGNLKQVDEILRQMQRLTFGETSCRDALHLAMGRICSAAAVDAKVANLVLRTLLDRLNDDASDASTLLALGHVCQGQGASEEEMRAVSEVALKHLRVTQPDPTLLTSTAAGEELFVFEGVDVYAELIPACLDTLEQIVLAARCPESLRQEVIDHLLDLWQQTSGYEMQWGPAAIARTTEILGRIAMDESTDDPVRLRIANTLARRPGELSVLKALALLLAEGHPIAEFDRLAAAVLMRLLKLLDDREDMRQEDHETYLRLLATVGRRGRFEVRGDGEDRLIERMIEALAAGLRHGAPGCLKELVRLRDAGTLPPRHAERIRDEVSRFTTLALRS